MYEFVTPLSGFVFCVSPPCLSHADIFDEILVNTHYDNLVNKF